MRRLLLAGIGWHHPGDRAGWQALMRLEEWPPADSGWEGVHRRILHPGLDLLPALREVDAALLLDALPPGATASRLLRDQDLLTAPVTCSAHALGVSEALALAQSLGLLPPRLLLLGLGNDWEACLLRLAQQALQRM